MKIDLKKVYDMVSWTFLEKIFEGNRFLPVFVELVIICVRTIRFIVKMNSSGYGYFKGERG